MVRVVASSVRGPSHIREGLPCQDAWFAIANENASLAVVSDGLGSRSHAREGSLAATRAVRDAWRLWCRSPVGTVEDLIRLIEVIWRLRLQLIAPNDAATTCLLYAEDKHGRATLAQLGDGLIARRGIDGKVTIHPSRSEGFGVTHALGTPHTLADWSFTLTMPLMPGEVILLATDGVSEDLELERISCLMTWVIDELSLKRSPSHALTHELQNWPVPHHQDDKTLLVMWKSLNRCEK